MSKMKMSDRAKIFAPYDAIKGFKEMLNEQENIKEEKKTLSEEQLISLNDTLLSLETGMMIKVKYYNHVISRYEIKEGIFVKLDAVYKKIHVVKSKINISDILELEIIDNNLF